MKKILYEYISNIYRVKVSRYYFFKKKKTNKLTLLKLHKLNFNLENNYGSERVWKYRHQNIISTYYFPF